MAGPAISRALEKRDYLEFHRLVHDFSEQHIVPQLTAITSGFDLLERVASQESPLRPLDDPAIANGIRAAASEIRALEIGKRVRGYLWPGSLEMRDSEAANRARWAPYDGAAWDVFFGGLVDVVSPALEACVTQSDAVAALIESRPVSDPSRAEIALREIPVTMRRHCEVVRAALEKSHYEAVVAAWLERVDRG